MQTANDNDRLGARPSLTELELWAQRKRDRLRKLWKIDRDAMWFEHVAPRLVWHPCFNGGGQRS